MKYTAITKKPMTIHDREMPEGTRLEVVGLHDHTVSCIWNGSRAGMFTVLRTEVDIEEHPEGKVYDIHFNVSGHMRVTIEMDTDAPCLADADLIQQALEEGKLAISTTENGEAILLADGLVVGRTQQIKDETDWDDFSVLDAGHAAPTTKAS